MKKKTKSMKFYQQGLDFKPKSIAQNGESVAEKRRKEIIEATEKVIKGQPNANALKTLLLTTAYMENSLGANPKAYGRDYTRGFMSIDNNAYNDLYAPRGENNRQTASQKKYDQWHTGLGLQVNKMDSLLRVDNPVANMAAARSMYGRAPEALPAEDDVDALYNYYKKNYNKGGQEKHQKDDKSFERFKEGYEIVKSLNKKQAGGIIEDNMGQWSHPGEITKINSNKITMQGVDYPVLGVSDAGDTKMMLPGRDYRFKGKSVTEYPMMQQGGNLPQKLDDLTNFSNYNMKNKKAQMGAGISPNSQLDISTLNFRDQVLKAMSNTQPGQFDKSPSLMEKLLGPPTKNKKLKSAAKAAMTRSNLKNGGYEEAFDGNQIKPFNVSEDIMKTMMPKVNQRVEASMANLTTPQTPSASFMDKLDPFNTAMGIASGIGMLKQQKEQRKEAKQFAALSDVVSQAADTRPERVRRKYARPEDQLVDPNQLSNSFGVGTNYLEQGGEIPEAFFGFMSGTNSSQVGNAAGALGSLMTGGKGQIGGGSMLGSTVGNTVGNFIPIPGASQALSAVGGLVGGLFDGGDMKYIRNKTEAAQKNLQQAALQQSVGNTQQQFSSFMENGGWMSHNWNPQVITKFGDVTAQQIKDSFKDMDTLRMGGNLRQNFIHPEEFMQMGGQLQTLWGGKAEPVSVNPYLPGTGESVLFKGDSHDEGGIGITFGKTPVEVEGGEPAVKLKDGGTGGDNLVVFGNMEIPAYGASEIGDSKAQGKKFKNYVNELNKKEAKQNKIIDNTMKLTEEVTDNSLFDRLKLGTANANMIGTDMKLKDIAQKKQTASAIQNAILESANELNLDPAALSKGKIKTAKHGGKFGYAQNGKDDIKSISLKDISELLKQGYTPEKEQDYESKTFFQKVTPGKKAQSIKQGSPEFNKAFAEARKAGLKEFEFNGKKHNTNLADTISTPDKIELARLDWDAKIKDLAMPNLKVKTPKMLTDGFPISNLTNSQVNSKSTGDNNFLSDILNSALPWIRPSNQRNLDPNQLAGEMFALASNQLEPVQAQLYNPLLEQVTDVSYQDQLNANQADFNAMLRTVGNNPAAQATLAAQKYGANSQVLGEQFRQNQGQRLGTYNRNRTTLNDATLKNLAILDQQFTRQAQAKSNTKATAQAALNSISDKIQRNKLENRTLGIYENLYNYRFGPRGYAWNLNAPAQFNIPDVGDATPTVDSQGRTIDSQGRAMYPKFNSKGEQTGYGIVPSTASKKTKSTKNGGLVKAMKNL
jgi:hypothetical protein